MADTADIHVSDTTLPKLSVTTTIDLTLQTAVTLDAKAPSGATKTFIGSVTATPTDGIIEYNPFVGDFDEAGLWEIQAHVVLSDGTDTRGRVAIVLVGPKLI